MSGMQGRHERGQKENALPNRPCDEDSHKNDLFDHNQIIAISQCNPARQGWALHPGSKILSPLYRRPNLRKGSEGGNGNARISYWLSCSLRSPLTTLIGALLLSWNCCRSHIRCTGHRAVDCRTALRRPVDNSSTTQLSSGGNHRNN